MGVRHYIVDRYYRRPAPSIVPVVGKLTSDGVQGWAEGGVAVPRVEDRHQVAPVGAGEGVDVREERPEASQCGIFDFVRIFRRVRCTTVVCRGVQSGIRCFPLVDHSAAGRP